MNRQNYQQIGFIIALVVAGVSLPTSMEEGFFLNPKEEIKVVSLQYD